MRKASIVASAIILLASGLAFGSGTEVVIGVAQPEIDTSAVGWDATPAAGNWGGRGADGTFAVAWENDSPDVPDVVGRFAEVTIPGMRGVTPTRIEIHYLAGIANDDFCVLISGAKWPKISVKPKQTPSRVFVAIGCINDDAANTNEVWTSTLPTQLTLPAKLFYKGTDITIQIRVTGNAWSGFPTWGQLAIDYIRVWGVRK